MADYNGTVETFPDGLTFNVEGPADNPIVESFDDLAPHGLLLFSTKPTAGTRIVRVTPKLVREIP